jgi:phosphatidylserine decarboxylase
MRRLPIAKQGSPYIVGLAVLLLLFGLLGWAILTVLTLIVSLLVINFFRDPERTIPQDPQAVLAPADGRIIFAGKVFEDRFLNKETLKISIFMSIFNVHVNRIPFSGEVESVHYEKGTFFAAHVDKASRIVFIQIAGLVARRIDCWLKPGERVQRGDRFGMIRFGSRLDIFVPTDSRLAVNEGQGVKAGESILCYHRKDK